MAVCLASGLSSTISQHFTTEFTSFQLVSTAALGRGCVRDS